MLYAFFGTDTVGVRQKAHEHVHRYEEKGIAVVRITPENFGEGALKDAAGSTSLFGGEQVYVLDTPSEDPVMFEGVFENLDLCAESENIFILVEEKLLAPQKKKLQKYARECVEITATAKKEFNPFALSDALLRRDKKSLWLLLQEAKANGVALEQTTGLLFAQLRALRLSARASSAAEAGMKPFVWGKAKNGLSKFKEGEVDELSRKLVEVYHDGHLGKQDMELALERWVLEV